MPPDQPSSNAINESTKFMNSTTIPNLDVPPHQVPSTRYPQHLPNPNALSNPPHNQNYSTPERRLRSTQAPTTNINGLPVPSIPNWSFYDTAILPIGETSGVDQGLIDSNSARGASGDFILSEMEDNVQTLFHNSFDIWGALEDQREGAEGMRF